MCLKSISPPSWYSQAGPLSQMEMGFLISIASGSMPHALDRRLLHTDLPPRGRWHVAPLGWAMSTVWVLIPAPTHPGAFCCSLHGQERSWKPARCFPTIMFSFTWSVLISRPCPSILVADSSEGFSLNLFFPPFLTLLRSTGLRKSPGELTVGFKGKRELIGRGEKSSPIIC